MARPQASDLFKVRFELDAFEKGGKRFIGGFITSGRKDKEGEAVLQRGLDFSHFLTKGFFNDNHDKSTGGIVGYPTGAEFKINPEISQKAWYAEGELLKTRRADEIWDVAQGLKKSGSGRKLGFSVEGKILKKREGGKIVKAAVRNVAITPNPINSDTNLNVLAKSLDALFVNCPDDECEIEDFDDLAKSLGPGYSTDSEGATDGDALKKESLEGGKDPHDLHIPGEFPEKKKKGDEEDDDDEMTIGKAFDKIMVLRPEISDPHVVLNLAIRVKDKL